MRETKHQLFATDEAKRDLSQQRNYHINYLGLTRQGERSTFRQTNSTRGTDEGKEGRKRREKKIRRERRELRVLGGKEGRKDR